MRKTGWVLRTRNGFVTEYKERINHNGFDYSVSATYQIGHADPQRFGSYKTAQRAQRLVRERTEIELIEAY